jgi:hypothetical protein
MWTTAFGKILTLYNLRKMHVIMMNWCCMCKKSAKSINHFLHHYEVAKDLWVSVFFFFFFQDSVRRVISIRVLSH